MIHEAEKSIKQVTEPAVNKAKEVTHEIKNAVAPVIHEAEKSIKQATTTVVSTVKEGVTKVEEIERLQSESWKKIQAELHMPDWVSDGLMGAPTWENSGPRHWLQDKGKEFDSWWNQTKPSWGVYGDIADLRIGGGKAVWDMGDGLLVLYEYSAKSTNYLYQTTHPEETRRTRESLVNGVEFIYHHPDQALSHLWSGLTQDYTDAWNSGHRGQAIGRGIVDIGSLFIGVGQAKAAGKAGGLVKVTEKGGKVTEAAGWIGKADEFKVVGKAEKVSETVEIAGKGLASDSDIGKTLNSITSRDKSNFETVLKSAKDTSKSKELERAAQGRAFDKLIQEKLSFEFEQGIRIGQDPAFYKPEFLHSPGRKFRADHAAFIENKAGKEGISIIENKLTGRQITTSTRVLKQAENYGNVIGRNILEGRPVKLKYIFAESSTKFERDIFQNSVNRGIQDGMREQQQNLLMQRGEFYEIPSKVDFKVEFVDYELNLGNTPGGKGIGDQHVAWEAIGTYGGNSGIAPVGKTTDNWLHISWGNGKSGYSADSYLNDVLPISLLKLFGSVDDNDQSAIDDSDQSTIDDSQP